jgi:ABC-2 type transport system permease protein
MFNLTLYKHELKKNWKLFVIFVAIITMYVAILIQMFNPKSLTLLDGYFDLMPEFMAAVGMKKGIATLSTFLASYLYDFILIALPMALIIIYANKLIAKYVDNGSMVSLLAAPIKRTAVAFTQMKVLATAIFLIVLYIFVVEWAVCGTKYPDLLNIKELLLMNAGLFSLLLFIGGICFLCSCVFSDTKRSIGFGAGIPVVMFVVKMLANNGGDLENLKYCTFFTLFNPSEIINGDTNAIAGTIILFVAASVMYFAGIIVFKKKDLCI